MSEYGYLTGRRTEVYSGGNLINSPRKAIGRRRCAYGSPAWRDVMKRWNGWGEETITTSLAAPATAFIQRIVGVATPPRDTTLAEMVAHIPPSRLPTSTLVSVDPEERLRHARGQSLPDLIALCSGCIDTFPDGVAYPASASEVRDLISYAAEVGACLIPYGGGTSVVGHITPLAGDR